MTKDYWMRAWPRLARWVLPALAALLLSGCRDDAMTVYRVTREAVPPPVPLPSLGGEHAGHVHSLAWETPAGWVEEAPGALRRASLRVPPLGEGGRPGDLSISSLAGDGGGLAGNLNRWRGQLGLPPLSDAELAAGAEPLRTPVGPGVWTTMQAPGEAPDREATLAVILPFEADTWFFKLSGPADLLETQREALRALIASLRVVEAGHP